MTFWSWISGRTPGAVSPQGRDVAALAEPLRQEAVHAIATAHMQRRQNDRKQTDDRNDKRPLPPC